MSFKSLEPSHTKSEEIHFAGEIIDNQGIYTVTLGQPKDTKPTLGALFSVVIV